MARILFVLEHYFPHVGGVETLFRQLVRELVVRGHEVEVITASMPDAPATEMLEGANITRVRCPSFGRRYAFTLFAIPIVLRKAHRSDVIHTTTYNAALPAWLAAKIARIPAVITVHEVWADQWSRLPGLSRVWSWGFRLFEWIVLRLPFDHYLCVSRHTRDRLIRHMKVPEGEASVSYPPFDAAFWDRRKHNVRPLRQELGLSEDRPLYLYFGRAGYSKGLEYLLDAIAINSRRSGAVLVALVPPKPRSRYSQLLRQIEDLGISGSVVLLEPVPRDQLPSYLMAADAVVIPSISEGFGYSALEAVSLGCPTIATSGHSVQEILPDSARFVPPRDSHALAEALMRPSPDFNPAPPPRFTVEDHVDKVLAAYSKIGIDVTP